MDIETQAAVLLWSALQSRRSFFTPYRSVALLTDFLLNVLSILFATTMYSSMPVLLNLLLISPAMLISVLSEPRPSPRSSKPSIVRSNGSAPGVLRSSSKQSEKDLDPFPVRPFLTTYRGAMMIVTCMAILAVDFRVFPRRFAKAENWGTSLMDMGVGSFVFSAGVVSARSVLKDQASSSSAPLISRLFASFRHSIPLLILGLIRLYSVKGLDYAEHVTEYGVHWNFFFTLALLPPFVELAHSITTTICPSYELLSVIVAAIYQVVLESTDLKAYILVSPRGQSLISKNREGVFSFIGYLAIFLAGRGTGMTIIPRSRDTAQTPSQARKQLLIRMGGLAVVWWSLFCVLSEHLFGIGQSLAVSRRLANLPYVVWVAAFNVTHLSLFCLIETLFFPSVHRAADQANEARESHRATSQIMRAVNQNGLAVFLVANLMTGMVNLGLKTLDAGAYEAMGILSTYAAGVTGVALLFDKMGWKLKL